MIQTRKLGIVNGNKGAKVHEVVTSAFDGRDRTACTWQDIMKRVLLDPSEANRLCQRCFKDRPLPWEGTT